jgi:predicted amidohydrolase
VFLIALAPIPLPAGAGESVRYVIDGIEHAAAAGAEIVCFPECAVPGYRGAGKQIPPPDAALLEEAWSRIAREAARHHVAVILGTERLRDGALTATALVIDAEGQRLGFQDKVQIDPSEEGTYTPGLDRQVFRTGALVFGVVICHEGWRYPETVRWAVRHGAQVVFHPHFHEADSGSFRPARFADPRNTFHEKAALCRAAENTCYFATVNYASDGSPTTSAIVNPDGTLLAFQPYGEAGVLTGELDLAAATGHLASRYKPVG